MKITSIKQQEKRKDRYSVYVDETYAFSLSEGALLELGLASGQELTAGQVDDYKRLSAEDKVYGNALRYAAMRRRSRWEMTSYLQRKEAPPALAEQVIDRLTGLGFVDDLAFAKAWVENRHLLKPTSKRKLQQELKAKRVAGDIIDRVLGDDGTADHQELLRIIANKRRQSTYQDETKMMQYLARQGFGYDDIKHAIAEANGDQT